MGIMPIEPVLLLIYALALARIAGFIVLDEIFDTPRKKILERLDDREWSLGWFVTGWLTCPWCVGVPLVAAALPVIWFHSQNPLVLIPALGLALAQVVGMTSTTGR